MSDAAAAPDSPPTRPRKRRWLRRVVVVLLLLAVVVRFGGEMALPSLLDREARKLGLEIRYERLDLSLLSLDVAIRHLDVRRRGDPERNVSSESLAHADSIAVDVGVLALLVGDLRIERAEVAGLEAQVTRLADGGFAFGGWRLPVATDPATPPAAAPGPGPADPRVAVAADRDPGPSAATPLDFTLPIEIEECGVSGALVHWRDESCSPALVTDVSLQFRAGDLGAPQRPGRISLSVRAKEGALHFSIEGKARGPQLRGTLALEARGVSTELVRRLAPQAGLAPHARSLDLEFAATIALSGALNAKGGGLRAIGGSIEIDRLVLTSSGPDGGEELALAASATIERLSRQEADITLAVVDLQGRAVRLENGGWRAAGFDLQDSKPAAPTENAAPVAVAASPAAPETEPDTPPFRLRLRELRPSLALKLRDETATPPVEHPIALRDAVIKNFELGGGDTDTPPTIAVAVEAGGASVQLQGSLDARRKPPQVVVDLQVGHAEALLKRLGIDAALTNGTLELHVTAEAQREGESLVAGGKLERLRFHDGERELASLDAVEVPKLVSSDAGIVIEQVRLVGPLVAIDRDASGALRFAGIALPGGSSSEPAAASAAPAAVAPPAAAANDAAPAPAPAPAPESPPPSFDLRELHVEGARVVWNDAAIAPPVAATVGIDVKVTGVKLGAAEPASFELLAKIDGALERLRLAGTAQLAAKTVAADLELDGVQLAPLSSYLPPELARDLHGGRLRLHVDAAPPSVVVTSLVVDQWTLRVASGGEAAAPLDVALSLQSRAPLALWGADPGELPPLSLDLVAQAPPLAGELRVAVDAAPFAGRPSARVTVDGRGLAGAELAKFFPDLGSRIDASALTDGTFHAQLDVDIALRRRAPFDFDLRGGVGGEVRLTDVELRSAPEQPPLAGVESITAEVASYRPAHGDLILRSLEIVKPIADVRRTKDGPVIGGIRLIPAAPSPLPPPPASTPPPTNASEPPKEAAPPPEAAPAPAPAATIPAPPGPEFRIDDLVVRDSGIQYVDEIHSPPRSAPIAELQIEVQNFTTRALTESRPLQFHVFVRGGDIELPVRENKSLVSKLASSATDLAQSGKKEIPLERRPAWRQLDAAGQVTLAPHPTGWVRLDLDGFELQTIQGVASTASIAIDDGVVDSAFDVRLLGQQGLAVDSRTTFSYLKVHEPPGGPISSVLKLPLPLDSVLFLLRDANGEQQVPLRFKVDQAGLDFGKVARVASATLLRLISDAVRSAPTRALRGTLDATQLTKIPGIEQLTDVTSLSKLTQVTGLDALFGDVSKQPLCDPVVLEFEPGSSRLPAEADAQAKVLLERMRKDPTVIVLIEHHLGEGDHGRIARLAQPAAADVTALLRRLRRRREEIAARRELAALEARGAMATGRGAAAAAAIEEVRTLERERTTVEDALDLLFERHDALERGDSSDDGRILRSAIAAFAELRLAAARDLIEEGGIAEAATRIQTRSPRASDVVIPGRSRIVITPRQRR